MDGARQRYRLLESRWIHFTAWGHGNVKALHKSTFEITRESFLTPRGDCIIGVRSSIAASDLPEWFRDLARRRDSLIVLVLCSGGVCDSVVGRGDPGLEMSDGRRMIFRRSTYTEPATVMVGASKAARDLDRRLVERLAASARLDAYLTAIPGPVQD